MKTKTLVVLLKIFTSVERLHNFLCYICWYLKRMHVLIRLEGGSYWSQGKSRTRRKCTPHDVNGVAICVQIAHACVRCAYTRALSSRIINAPAWGMKGSADVANRKTLLKLSLHVRAPNCVAIGPLRERSEATRSVAIGARWDIWDKWKVLTMQLGVRNCAKSTLAVIWRRCNIAEEEARNGLT